jgi:hypothetical protein
MSSHHFTHNPIMVGNDGHFHELDDLVRDYTEKEVNRDWEEYQASRDNSVQEGDSK